MAMFQIYALDEQVKALPTLDTASGSIASFNTDLTENLVEVKCQIVATQSGSGTPSPSNPRPITTYTSLNLSHSGADTSNPNVTNIPFGQTVANGMLDITTGKLRVTWGVKKVSEISWSRNGTYNVYYGHCVGKNVGRGNVISDNYNTNPVYWEQMNNFEIAGTLGTDELNIKDTSFTSLTDFETNRANVVIVYELATAIEIQLDSITLQALLNENNIWCDTGDTEVKFLLTVGKKIS